ncbi:MAG: hypothetical protein ABSA67_06615 [Candidatus Brocadiia bacterium]|jgi:hypothetical protein
MAGVIAVDRKGIVYLIPQAILTKHCKKVGWLSEKKRKVPGRGQVQGQGDDWLACQAWVNCSLHPK